MYNDNFETACKVFCDNVNSGSYKETYLVRIANDYARAEYDDAALVYDLSDNNEASDLVKRFGFKYIMSVYQEGMYYQIDHDELQPIRISDYLNHNADIIVSSMLAQPYKYLDFDILGPAFQQIFEFEDNDVCMLDMVENENLYTLCRQFVRSLRCGETDIPEDEREHLLQDMVSLIQKFDHYNEHEKFNLVDLHDKGDASSLVEYYGLEKVYRVSTFHRFIANNEGDREMWDDADESDIQSLADRICLDPEYIVKQLSARIIAAMMAQPYVFHYVWRYVDGGLREVFGLPQSAL